MRPQLLARRGALSSRKDVVATGSQLPWAPPSLYPVGSQLVEYAMTNANRNTGALINGSNRDLVITCNEVLTGPVYQIGGGGGGPWRNVVWIGGEINYQPGSGDNYALPIAATGTVHLEGLKITIDGDAMMSRGGGPSAIWQVQNCRNQVHFLGEPREHADCFQFQGNTKLDKLRFARSTFVTDYQGFMLRFPDAAAYCNSGDFRQINFRRRNAGQDPAQAYIFIPDEDPAMGHGAGQTQIGNTVMTDVWIEATHSSPNSVLYPSWLFEGFHSGIGPGDNKEGLFRETDAQGQYVRPSTTADVVPPGGSASGQQAESAGWTGIIRMGVPPGGDYCPASVPGVGYISPGYV